MKVAAPLNLTRSGHVIIGVDTHKHVHVASVMDSIGGILASSTIATDNLGYQQLLDWATGFGQIIGFGIEGTGSYGSALTSFIRRNGHRVIEVNRPDRRMRRLVGKSDTLDAKNAARAVLAGFATAEPKTADGTVEMIRQLKVAHDTAVKDRSSAMITLKAMLIHGSDQLRQDTGRKTQIMLARHLASLRPTRLETPDDSIRHTLRFLARRWLALDAEITELETMIQDLVLRTAPQFVEPFGIGIDTAAEILIVVGDNPERIRSEAALAKLAGISPIPASSGMTLGRHRINHGGHRQLNAAIYRTVIVRMRFHQPTINYVARRTAEGLSKRDIIRCLKRYVIREVLHLIQASENAVLKTS